MHCKSLWIKASAKCINVNVMEHPVITVCNYVDVIGSYCYTYVTDRVCYTATYVMIVTYVLQTLYNIIINVSTQT